MNRTSGCGSCILSCNGAGWQPSEGLRDSARTMTDHWVLGSRLASSIALPLPQVSALLARLGQSDRHAVAEDLLRLVEAFAPLIVHTVRLHHTGQAVHQDVSGLLLARLVRRFPALTQRDHDVVAALTDGLSTEALAARLGLTLASARTYQKRAYRKLGVAGQRELLALLLDSGA